MLKWVPEKLPASGGLSAEGFYKLLGRPTLDPLTVLVREMAQNSWDARLEGAMTVRFALELRKSSAELRHFLRAEVFEQAQKVHGTKLKETLEDRELQVLTVSDRGTRGLDGPVTADEEAQEGRQNWANFVLNAGKSKSEGNTGGTYGFGKTIAYVVSQANSIVIHTRTQHEGGVKTRLIGAAIGRRFVSDGKNFTGRHWWGLYGPDAPLPVEGDAADELADKLGLPAFEEGDLGTNIMIIAPDLGQRTPQQAVTFLAESILWHLWPKLIPRHDGVPHLQCSLQHDGNVVSIPDYNSRPPLARYVEAYRDLVMGHEASLTFQKKSIQRLTPKKLTLGNLGTVPFAREHRAVVDDGHDSANDDSPAPASPFAMGPAHHVALLRSPELVVDYLPGPIAPDPAIEWVGVFRAADEHDGIFARAEPPTHDAWNPETVDDRVEKNILRKVLRDIQKAVTERWGAVVSPPAEEAVSTAGIADALGHLVLGKRGQGKGREPGQVPSASPSANRASVSFVGSAVDLADELHMSKAIFDVTPAKGQSQTRLRIAVAVALDGSSGDTSLDQTLHLRQCSIDGAYYPLEGTHGTVTLVGNEKRRVVLEAANSGRMSILWDVDAHDSPGGEN
jgi:hypothetical protein